MKKTVKKLTAVVLALMLMLTCSMPAFAGDPGWIEEITAAQADEKYNSGNKCIIFFYQDGCYNCYNIETNVISNWLEYGVIIYAVNLPVEGWPDFLKMEYGGVSISTPIVAFVNGACTSYYMGATSFDVLNNAFYDFYNITPPVSVTGVTLSQTSASLEIGDTLQLYATVSPSTANQSVTWASSNTSVATVSSSGYVTAKASGSAYITATTADGSYNASCYVSVSECEASLESISIRTKPNKTTYTVGESFNTAGLTLNLHYSDGTTQVATSGFTCSKPDMSTAGEKIVTVSYKCYMTSFSIKVNAKPTVSVSSISIRTNPSKTTYTVGESFNSSGLTLNVYYSDGTSKSVTSGFTCSKPDMSTAGTKKVTVTYKGKTASFNITVKAKPATLSSISIKTNPSKTTYNIGESFNSSGLTLTAKYSDGTSKTVTSGFTCSKPDMSTAGTKTVTVTYQGKTASFKITVKAATIKATSVDIIVEKDFEGTNKAKLGATVNPSNASYKSLVWSSSDPNVVAVAYDGSVTTMSVGVATITVTVTNHDGTTVSDSIEVTVEDTGSSGSLFDAILKFFMSILDLLLLPFTLLFGIL